MQTTLLTQIALTTLASLYWLDYYLLSMSICQVVAEEGRSLLLRIPPPSYSVLPPSRKAGLYTSLGIF